MNQTTIAIIIGSLIISIGLACTTPRYEIIPVPTSANPAVWRLDRLSGDVSLCATANGKDTESGCTVKLKQF